MTSVTWFLGRRLKLQVNRDKSQVIPTDQCTFLGFAFRGTKISWSDKSLPNARWNWAMLSRVE